MVVGELRGDRPVVRPFFTPGRELVAMTDEAERAQARERAAELLADAGVVLTDDERAVVSEFSSPSYDEKDVFTDPEIDRMAGSY